MFRSLCRRNSPKVDRSVPSLSASATWFVDGNYAATQTAPKSSWATWNGWLSSAVAWHNLPVLSACLAKETR